MLNNVNLRNFLILTGNRTYDIARSSRTTPTSTESQVQAESVSS